MKSLSKITRYKTFRLVVSALLSLIFLWLAIRQIQIESALEHIRSARIELLLVGLLIWLFGYVIRIYRWGHFLKPLDAVSFSDAGKALMVGFAANNTLPFRAGEFVRAYVLHTSNPKIPISSGFATVVGERIFDGLAVVSITLFGATALTLPIWASRAINVSVVLFAGTFIIFWLLVVYPQKRALVLNSLRRVGALKVLDPLFGLVEKFFSGLNALASPKKVCTILLLSFSAWFIEVVFYYLSAVSFGIPISFLQACFLMGILNLGIMVPAAPGGIGTFEFITIESLKLVGVGQSLSFGYGVVSHLLQNGSVILIGGIMALTMGMDINALQGE